MTKKLIVLAIIFNVIISCSPKDSKTIEYNKFNKLLGKEKAVILKKAVDSFDEFLKMNFSNQTNYNQRVLEFLKQLSNNHYHHCDNWIYNFESGKEIIDLFEKSGLRKEIWIYHSESDEIDSEYQKYYDNYNDSLSFNINTLGSIENLKIPDELVSEMNDSLLTVKLKQDSLIKTFKLATTISEIVIALHKIKSSDSLLINYAETRLKFGSITSSILVKRLLENSERLDFNNPLIKSVLVIEFYYNHLNSEIETYENEQNT